MSTEREDSSVEPSNRGMDNLITCSKCQFVYDIRYLPESCRFEEDLGYLCMNCGTPL